MADRTVLARALVRAAKLRATQLGGANTPKSVLEAILLGQFTSSATNGKTLIRSGEAGGFVEFEVQADLGPADIIELVETALTLIENSPDPLNPAVGGRRIMRLKVSFGRAIL